MMSRCYANFPKGLFLPVLLVFTLFSAACGGGGGGEPVVIPPPLAAVASGLWSDPATWGGEKPADYQEVTIPAGTTVTLDENTPALGILLVDGGLVFGESDLELRTGRIEVRGKLEVGTELSPFLRRAVITLGGNPGDSDPKLHNGLWVMPGGTLDLHGEPRGPGWTRLAQTASDGTNELVLQEPVSWRPGDRIVVASTDFDMNQAEEMTVSAVTGNVVTLIAPLRFTHWGATESGVEERAEVGLLSRNVVVQGYEGSTADGQGGHQLAMAGSTMRISGVEFTRMGHRGKLARYPVHFHMMGDATGSYARDNSIHHNFNRGVTIHGSHNAVVQGNVAYDTLGHCYFFEDGIETGNLLENNLGLLVSPPPVGSRIIESDADPAVFWVSNPDNILRANAAAGSTGFGFWYDLPVHPTGPSATDTVFPQHTPLGEFSGNVAHSNQLDGMMVDNIEGKAGYHPKAGALPTGAPAPAEFSSFTSFKNRNRGAWVRGDRLTLLGSAFADNAIGVTFASHSFGTESNFFRTSVIAGETANQGNPQDGVTTGLDDRTLPKPSNPDFPIRGFEFYDGMVSVENVGFVNLQPNGQRQAGALSDLRFDRFGWHTGNNAAGLVFTNANQAYFDPLGAHPVRPDDEDGHRSALFIDKDGSVTGTAGQTVTVNNPFLVDDACTFRSEWNAFVCPPTYAFGRLAVENQDAVPLAVTPVRIIRPDGLAQTLAGIPFEPRKQFNTSLLDGRPYRVEFSGAVPQKLRLRYRYRTPGDWVQVSLPYPHTPFKVIRDGAIAAPLAAAGSLAELSASAGNLYFHDGTNLHLKLMVQAGRDNAMVDIGP
jgi:cell migration-inducing and hyaluronan-binding protein